MKEEESLSLVSALTAPTDCMVLSLGVSAELGEVWEEESVAGPGCCTATGEHDDMELGMGSINIMPSFTWISVDNRSHVHNVHVHVHINAHCIHCKPTSNTDKA